ELTGFLMQGLTAPVPADASTVDLGQFAGYYRDLAPMQEILGALNETFGGTEIQLRSDGLWERTHVLGGLKSLVLAGPWQPLIPVGGEGSFRHADESVSSRYFTRTDTGAQALVTPMGYFERSPTWL